MNAPTGETPLHRLLKASALLWVQREGYSCCATEVSVPPAGDYRADVAAYRPGHTMQNIADPRLLTTRRVRQPAIGVTALLECKQSRTDFLKDSRSLPRTLEKLRELQARRTALEEQLRLHHPSLLQGETLFPEYDTADFDLLRHDGYTRLRREITLLSRRLHAQTKFDRLLRPPCANLHYLVAPPGLIEAHELPEGWGLLQPCSPPPGWPVGCAPPPLNVVVRPVWHDCSDPQRLALLHRIAQSALRSLNQSLGITFEDICRR